MTSPRKTPARSQAEEKEEKKKPMATSSKHARACMRAHIQTYADTRTAPDESVRCSDGNLPSEIQQGVGDTRAALHPGVSNELTLNLMFTRSFQASSATEALHKIPKLSFVFLMS